MATQIQFKKVASLPEQLEKGTVYFNSTTHSIFVAKTDKTTDEFGGRLKDVTYESGVLTITKYTEDAAGTITYALDFTDVASTTDVTKVLSGLYSRVSTVEGLVATNTENIKNLQDTLGTGDTSLVTRVTTAEEEIDTLETTVYGTLKKDGTRDTDGLNNKVTNNTAAIANKAERGGSSEQIFKVADPGTDSSAATPKSYVDNAISNAVSSVYRVKGCLDNKEALLNITNPSVGDVYNVTSEVVVKSTDVGSGVGKFGKAGTFPAGTNWVWVKHSSDTSQATGETTTTEHWDAIGGMITGYATDTEVSNISTRVASLEKGENTVKTFGGQSGIINIKADNDSVTNGTVLFSLNDIVTDTQNVTSSNLTATVKGIADAAFKAVDKYDEEAKITYVPSDSTNIPTSNLVNKSLSSLHATITSEIKNNSTMTWASWPEQE